MDNVKRGRSPFDSLKQRVFLAVVMVLITTTLMIPGMTTYLPFSMADQIALPILLFPFVWTGLFVYCFMAKKVWHVWCLLGGISLSHLALSLLALQGGLS